MEFCTSDVFCETELSVLAWDSFAESRAVSCSVGVSSCFCLAISCYGISIRQYQGFSQKLSIKNVQP